MRMRSEILLRLVLRLPFSSSFVSSFLVFVFVFVRLRFDALTSFMSYVVSSSSSSCNVWLYADPVLRTLCVFVFLFVLLFFPSVMYSS